MPGQAPTNPRVTAVVGVLWEARAAAPARRPWRWAGANRVPRGERRGVPVTSGDLDVVQPCANYG